MKLYSKIIAVITVVFSVIMGGIYYLNLLGFKEKDVKLSAVGWGRISLILGVFALLLLVYYYYSNKNLLRFFQTGFLTLLILINLPPIFLWVMFHGSNVGEYPTADSFYGHWAYSIPHLFQVIMCIISICFMLNKNNENNEVKNNLLSTIIMASIIIIAIVVFIFVFLGVRF